MSESLTFRESFLGTTRSGAHRGEDVLTPVLKIHELGLVQLKKKL